MNFLSRFAVITPAILLAGQVQAQIHLVSDEVRRAALFIGGDQINARAQATGNPNLAPETSKNFTAGITWDVTGRLTLDLNYYTVVFENLIVPESAGAWGWPGGRLSRVCKASPASGRRGLAPANAGSWPGVRPRMTSPRGCRHGPADRC